MKPIWKVLNLTYDFIFISNMDIQIGAVVHNALTVALWCVMLKLFKNFRVSKREGVIKDT